jgi:diaminopimelate epimerase
MWSFVKYHSLGNDLILFDWRHVDIAGVTPVLRDPAWSPFVQNICTRHFGVGANGVLVLTRSSSAGLPEVLIFNEDGSQAELCVNGLRCVADYLFSHDPSAQSVQIQMGQKKCLCSRVDGEICSDVGRVECLGQRTVSIGRKSLVGHCVHVGNPHFIIMERTTEDWLARYGKRIESHALFPQRTNVEFVWPTAEPCTYQVLIYERGCGPTLACGSGAAAITGLFVQSGAIKEGTELVLQMPGGRLISWIEPNGHVILRARAQRVFSGSIEAPLLSSPITLCGCGTALKHGF